MTFPVGVSSFWEAMRTGAEVYNHLKNLIKEKYGKDATNVSGEGRFALNTQKNTQVLKL